MNKTGLTDEDLSTIINLLKTSREIKGAVLFGSRGRGNFKKGSDVDIALKGENLSNEVITRISYLLNEESLMPYKFDVIHLDNVKNEELVKEINKYGIIIYQV